MNEENSSEENSTEEPEELDLRGELEAAISDDTPDEPVSETASEAPQEDTQAAGGEPQGEAAPGGGSASETQPEAPGSQAPIDWDASLREGWKDLPQNVREKVIAREKQIEQAMQGASQGRRAAQELGRIQQTYGQIMASEGVRDPIQMLDGLMQTVSTLKMGTTAQKAQQVADLIKHYDIDLKTLDSHLAASIKGQPAPSAPDDNVAALIDQRMAPVNQMMQQLAGMQHNKQAQQQQAAVDEVNQFGQTAEFLNDVRHDMADLIDLATRQGRQMSLKDAYDKACAMNPQINQVLQQRAEKERLVQASQNLNGKRAAATSLAPGNQGANSNSSGDSLLSAINAAWDDQLGRG